VFPEEVYSVFTEEGKVAGEMRPAVQRQCSVAELRAYQNEKHGLDEGRYDGVDWKSLHGFLRKQSPPKRALYVKQQNGWLPTQSFLFRQKRVESDLCPLCGGSGETAEHIYRCQCEVALANRTAALTTFRAKLRQAGTAPEITNCWMEHLYWLMEAGPFVPSFIHDSANNRRIADAVAIARRHQALLSWEGFVEGRLSKEWRKVQQLHEQMRGATDSGGRRRKPWVARAMDLVCDLVPDLWRFRNSEVHGITLTEKLDKERKRVHSRVRRLYEEAPELLPRYHAIKAVPIEERLKQPTFVLQLWLRQVARQRAVTDQARRRAAELQQSIEPFLAKRRGRLVLEASQVVRNGVFDRGR